MMILKSGTWDNSEDGDADDDGDEGVKKVNDRKKKGQDGEKKVWMESGG